MVFSMAGGIEFIMGFDFFTFDWFTWIFFTGFILVFAYIGYRATEDKAWDKALLTTGATMLVALFCALTSLPSFWSGIIVLLGFVVAKQRLTKPSWHVLISSFIFLWVLVAILAIIPGEFGYAFDAFLIIMFYLLSEFDIRAEKKKKDSEKDKPKK